MRAHLNLEPGVDEALLTHYADAAETWVENYTGTPCSGHPLEVQAVLMIVAHSYEPLEAVSFANPYTVPFGVHDQLASLKERVTGAA